MFYDVSAIFHPYNSGGFVEINHVVLFRPGIFDISPFLLFEKEQSPFFQSTYIINHRCFVMSMFEISKAVYSREILNVVNVFSLFFAFISLWMLMWSFLKANLNLPNTRILYVKFGWNWSRGFEEEDENVKSVQNDGHSDVHTNYKRWTTDEQKSSLKLTTEVKLVSFNYLLNWMRFIFGIFKW